MTRISKQHFPNTFQRSPRPREYAMMFIRDIQLAIIPPPNSKGDTSLRVKLHNNNPKLESQLIRLMDSLTRLQSFFKDNDINDATIQLINTLTNRLAHFGEVYIEIISTKTQEGIESKELGILPPGKILKIPNKYIQVIPPIDRGNKESKFILIPSNKIWQLKMPASLGGSSKHRKIIKRLNALSQLGPAWIHKEHKSIDYNPEYDFWHHQKSKDLAMASITGIWSGVPSYLISKGTTEYYRLTRKMQFTYCQALLREHIIHEFNSMLKKEGIHNEIKIEGISTANDIKTMIYKLPRNKVNFNEVVKTLNLAL